MPMKRRRDGRSGGEQSGGPVARPGQEMELLYALALGRKWQDCRHKVALKRLAQASSGPPHQCSNKANPAASDPCSVRAAQRREIMIVPLTNLPVPFQPIFQSLSEGSDILSLSQLINSQHCVQW